MYVSIVQVTNIPLATFIVSRKAGGAIYANEALNLLQPLGEIAKVKQLGKSTQASLNLPPSILVSYKMYDAKRDVVKVGGYI